jgi:SAM-dependent methyltransferase
MSTPDLDRSVRIWKRYYSSLQDAYLFPNEYVIRSFLGEYPNLSIPHDYKGKRVCDISCGDGRNLTALHKFGFDLYASEISDDIVEITKSKLATLGGGITVDIRTGFNSNLPFDNDFFDHMLSWNACYYMRDERSDISEHIAEYARIAKPGAYLVVSVPAPGCFSLAGSEPLGNDLIRIKTESKWAMLNGTIYHQFRSWDDIEARFGSHFHNFQKCTIKDDCYGMALEYFVFVCQKA